MARRGDVGSMGRSAGDAAISQLRETNIGCLSEVLRGLNFVCGLGLGVGSGLLTIWEALYWAGCDPSPGVIGGVGHPCSEVAAEAVNSGECINGGVCTESDYLECMQLCSLTARDIISTIIIAAYMPVLGSMLIMFELQRNWHRGCMRSTLERYFGFIFLYQKRTYFLLFCGLLSMCNASQSAGGECV